VVRLQRAIHKEQEPIFDYKVKIIFDKYILHGITIGEETQNPYGWLPVGGVLLWTVFLSRKLKNSESVFLSGVLVCICARAPFSMPLVVVTEEEYFSLKSFDNNVYSDTIRPSF